MQSAYRNDIDAWKGFAIIAVILYHLGILKSGYLGVEIFLVINGFLVVPSVAQKIQEGRISYISFLVNKMMRFMPLVVIASALCLAVGYTGMFPDDYENLAETAVASDIFSQNILASITTKDYWKSSNAFSPLMHMWYVGLLAEFYIVFPLLLATFKKITRNLTLQKTSLFLGFLSVFSLVIFLNPDTPAGDRFYLLPYRLFEFTLGGLVGLHFNTIQDKLKKIGVCTKLYLAGTVLLVATVCASLFFVKEIPFGIQPSIIGALSSEPLSSEFARNILTLVAALLSCALVSFNADKFTTNFAVRKLSSIGKMSFSLFVWHQVIIAFYRYFISPELSAEFICATVAILAVVTALSYRFVERINASVKNVAAFSVANVAVTGFAIWIYLIAGVVRDVPELDTYRATAHRNMFSEYCDRIYALDIDFPENGKPNILIVYASFARDFANVLLESDYREKVNVSYAFDWSPELAERIQKSDYIFAFGEKGDIPSYVFENVKPDAAIWGIGTKNFGMSNGNIYRKRHSPDYFEQSIEPSAELIRVNELLKASWGENYIDFVELSLDSNGRIPLFTREHKYISEDCNHFTQNGAVHFAKRIPWGKIFRERGEKF